MFLAVGFQEVMILVGIIVVLLLTTRFGVLKRTCDRFLKEFRKALNLSEQAPGGKRSEHDAGDEMSYQLLGLTPSATQAEIREAYRRKAQQHHPDKGGDPDMMRALTEAYRRLSQKR